MKLKKWLKEYWKSLLIAIAFFSITLCYLFYGSLWLGLGGIVLILVCVICFQYVLEFDPAQIWVVCFAFYLLLLKDATEIIFSEEIKSILETCEQFLKTTLPFLS